MFPPFLLSWSSSVHIPILSLFPSFLPSLAPSLHQPFHPAFLASFLPIFFLVRLFPSSQWSYQGKARLQEAREGLSGLSPRVRCRSGIPGEKGGKAGDGGGPLWAPGQRAGWTEGRGGPGCVVWSKAEQCTPHPWEGTRCPAFLHVILETHKNEWT